MSGELRLGRVGGMNVPRLHRFDHTAAGSTGQHGDIYVGYISPHLRNRGTS